MANEEEEEETKVLLETYRLHAAIIRGCSRNELRLLCSLYDVNATIRDVDHGKLWHYGRDDYDGSLNLVILAGETPLHFAAYCDREELMRVLLQHNPNVHVVIRSSKHHSYTQTPLWYAINRKTASGIRAARLLLAHDPDIPSEQREQKYWREDWDMLVLLKQMILAKRRHLVLRSTPLPLPVVLYVLSWLQY